MVLGKAAGSIITYKLANLMLSKEELERIMLNNTNSFYFRSLESMVAEYPYSISILIKLFFPSILASIGLALMLPRQHGYQQYILITMLSALLAATPTAILDFYPFMQTKVFWQTS